MMQDFQENMLMDFGEMQTNVTEGDVVHMLLGDEILVVMTYANGKFMVEEITNEDGDVITFDNAINVYELYEEETMRNANYEIWDDEETEGKQ